MAIVKGKRPVSHIVFDSVNLVIILAALFVTLYPFWYVICYSLSDASKMQGGLLLFPKGFTLNAYKVAFGKSGVPRALMVSVSRAVIGTVGSIFVTSIASYALSKDEAPGIRFLRKYFVLVMYLGGGLIPTYLIMRYVGLVGTFWVYIIPGLVSGSNLILMRTFIDSLPSELGEAAQIDGAGEFTAFIRVIFPMCVPIIAALASFTFIGQWNAYFDTMMYNFMERDLYTLQYLLYMTLTSSTATSLRQAEEMGVAVASLNPQSISMSITVISILPIMILFPFVQKHFKSGLLIGAVKA